MALSPIPDLSLVIASDTDECCRSSATPDVGWGLEGVFNVPELSHQRPCPPVSSDTDAAFRFQSDFLQVGDGVPEGLVAQWANAVRHGGGTPSWCAFVATWQVRMPGDRSRYALFQWLIQHFGQLDLGLRPLALECLLTDGAEGRAAVQRNWKRIGLGTFSREHWTQVQQQLRTAGLMR